MFMCWPTKGTSWITRPRSASSLAVTKERMEVHGFKTLRYLQGLKAEADEHSFFPEASGSARGLGIDSSLDSAWRLMPSSLSSYALSASRNVPNMQSTYPQLQSLHDLGQGTIGSSLSKQQQHSFFGGEFGNSPEPARHETHSLRPFLDEWPRSRDSWSDLDEARASRSSTQLSISLPMASSDFSTTSSMSPNDD